MKPLFIHNVDFIQLLMPVDEVITYFPVSSHLQGKKIHTLHLNLFFNGLDLSGKYPLVASFNAYITLYDIEGNLIIDKYPSIYFTNYYTGSTPVIDRIIDWEKSFIYWTDRKDGSGNKITTCMYFSVFIGDEAFPVPALNKQYAITLPVASNISEISLYNKLQAIAGKKITAVYYDLDASLYMTNTEQPVNAYLYLVPESPSNRYINNIPLLSLMNRTYQIINKAFSFWFYQTIYLEPTYIDFNRSKIFVRNIQNDAKTIKLIFYYE